MNLRSIGTSIFEDDCLTTLDERGRMSKCRYIDSGRSDGLNWSHRMIWKEVGDIEGVTVNDDPARS